uniref:Uncharacterized protein n=1 Tax=Oryza barthii TaxID=65489 RepID=A0A0D3HTK1_9ORYZ
MAHFDEIWGDVLKKIDQINERRATQESKAFFLKEAEQYENYGFTSELGCMTYDLGYEVPPKYTKVSTHVEDQLHCKTTVTLVFDKEDLPQPSFMGESDCFFYAREGVAYEALCRLRHHFKDRLENTIYHYHPKHGDGFWMNGCAHSRGEENQTIVHMTTMLDAIDDLHTDYKTQAMIQKHAQQEKIAKLQKMVEQIEDKPQPEDIDTAKMLKFTEARFA